MEGKVLLVSANRWNFTDENSNEQRTGTTVHLVHLNTSENTSDNVGNKPKKYTLDYSYFEKMKQLKLPCLATGLFEFNFNRDKMELIDIENVVELDGK